MIVISRLDQLVSLLFGSKHISKKLILQFRFSHLAALKMEKYDPRDRAF